MLHWWLSRGSNFRNAFCLTYFHVKKLLWGFTKGRFLPSCLFFLLLSFLPSILPLGPASRSLSWRSLCNLAAKSSSDHTYQLSPPTETADKSVDLIGAIKKITFKTHSWRSSHRWNVFSFQKGRNMENIKDFLWTMF